jgi:TatD DNase family protein
MYIDSHCHLSFPELHDQADALVQRMQDAQVHAAICICTELEEFERVHALALYSRPAAFCDCRRAS